LRFLSRLKASLFLQYTDAPARLVPRAEMCCLLIYPTLKHAKPCIAQASLPLSLISSSFSASFIARLPYQKCSFSFSFDSVHPLPPQTLFFFPGQREASDFTTSNSQQQQQFTKNKNKNKKHFPVPPPRFSDCFPLPSFLFFSCTLLSAAVFFRHRWFNFGDSTAQTERTVHGFAIATLWPEAQGGPRSYCCAIRGAFLFFFVTF